MKPVSLVNEASSFPLFKQNLTFFKDHLRHISGYTNRVCPRRVNNPIMPPLNCFPHHPQQFHQRNRTSLNIRSWFQVNTKYVLLLWTVQGWIQVPALIEGLLDPGSLRRLWTLISILLNICQNIPLFLDVCMA